MNTKTKKVTKRVGKEIKSILLVTLYFAIWFGVLIVLKKLILIDYNIQFSGISTALIGALILIFYLILAISFIYPID